MEYYQQLSWPQVPQELLDQISFSGYTSKILDYGQRYYRDQQEIFAPNWTVGGLSSRELGDWLIANIPMQFTINMIGQVLCSSTHDTYCEMIPHVDVIRSTSILYFIDTGGENATTAWYQEKDQPIVRTVRPGFDNQQTAEGWVEYSNLTELAQMQPQPNTWYKYRTDIIHGVKNLTGNRKFISISPQMNRGKPGYF